MPFSSAQKAQNTRNAHILVLDKSDGEKYMIGKNIGLVRLLKKYDVNTTVLYCIIHQEILYSKFV